MNIAYFRKSNFSLEETIAHVVENAQNQGWKVLGEANLPQESGKRSWRGRLPLRELPELRPSTP